jgi:diguanylate cyclase (GGDEF)-like protein
VTFPIPARGALEAVARARDVRRSLGVRLAAALFVGAGVLAFVSIPTLPSPTAGWITVAIGTVAVALGWFTAAAPWNRWRPGASFWLAPVALALIALANGVGSHEAYDYAAFYVVVHAWVGISQPRHASLWLAPVTAIAFVAPLAWIATDPAMAAGSVLVAVPASVLVGEGIAWLVAQLDASDRSLSDLSNIVTELEFTALHDVVTGLPNRAAFYEHIEVAIARARRSNERLIVCSLDLDKFKLVNDTLGHAAGDTLLEEMAARLRGILREGDVVARVGGDEFLMLLPASHPADADGSPDATAAAEEAAIAARIRDALEPPVRLRDTDVYVSASVGTAVFPTDATDVDALLRVADAKMYRSKRGRSAIGVIEDRDATAELELSSRLRASAKSQPWELHFQPIVELVTGRTVGAEALVRWNDPSHGLRTASEFLGLAEELDLGDDLTRWVIEELGQTASSWREDGVLEALTMITVNVSPRGLWQPGLTDRLRNVAECLGRRDLLVVEVTEAALSMDAARARDVLLTLRDDGMLIALDDFGTGYSSIGYLNKAIFHKLKIDGSFVREAGSRPENVAIIKSIVQLAKSFRMSVTAEGVETAEDFERMRELGCDTIQGYLFGKPLSYERANQMVLGLGAKRMAS